MQLETLKYQIEDGYAKCTINRPKALNALNQSVFADLETLFSYLKSQESVRAISLEGKGDKAFAAGADITEFLSLNTKQAEELSQNGQRIMRILQDFPVPVIALVKGYALGGGLELAMFCHTRICNESARFGLPEVNLGLMPGYGGSQHLTQLVGISKAALMTLTGDMIDAQEALSAGLVAKVFPDDEFDAKAEKLMKKLASKAPLATKAILKATRIASQMDLKGFERESAAFGNLMTTEDAREGSAAFLEKRKANFIGK